MTASENEKTNVDMSPELEGADDQEIEATLSEHEAVTQNISINDTLITLDRFPDDRLLTKPELAEVLGCSPRTLNRMVEKFEIPPGVILGGRCVWLAGKVKSWIVSSASRREAEAEKEAVRRRVFQH